jgi:stress-induced morphogen
VTPDQLKARLQEAYPDGRVEVIDMTGTHDHYQVYVESSVFQNMNRMQQHKNVMAVFAAELKTGEVHALTIKTVIKDK